MAISRAICATLSSWGPGTGGPMDAASTSTSRGRGSLLGGAEGRPQGAAGSEALSRVCGSGEWAAKAHPSIQPCLRHRCMEKAATGTGIPAGQIAKVHDSRPRNSGTGHDCQLPRPPRTPPPSLTAAWTGAERPPAGRGTCSRRPAAVCGQWWRGASGGRPQQSMGLLGTLAPLAWHRLA